MVGGPSFSKRQDGSVELVAFPVIEVQNKVNSRYLSKGKRPSILLNMDTNGVTINVHLVVRFLDTCTREDLAFLLSVAEQYGMEIACYASPHKADYSRSVDVCLEKSVISVTAQEG